MNFIKQLFCFHWWSDNILDDPINRQRQYWKPIGFKNWIEDTSCWVCIKCGKVKIKKYNYIPLQMERPKLPLTKKEIQILKWKQYEESRANIGGDETLNTWRNTTHWW